VPALQRVESCVDVRGRDVRAYPIKVRQARVESLDNGIDVHLLDHSVISSAG
jgi:hypothetical protein